MGRYPTSSGLAGAYLYLDVRIKWTKIVIVAHISDWDSLTLTYVDQFLQGIMNVVMKNVNCACGTCYNWNCNCGTRSRSGHVLRLCWFNFYLDRFLWGVLNLCTEL